MTQSVNVHVNVQLFKICQDVSNAYFQTALNVQKVLFHENQRSAQSVSQKSIEPKMQAILVSLNNSLVGLNTISPATLKKKVVTGLLGCMLCIAPLLFSLIEVPISLH